MRGNWLLSLGPWARSLLSSSWGRRLGQEERQEDRAPVGVVHTLTHAQPLRVRLGGERHCPNQLGRSPPCPPSPPREAAALRSQAPRRGPAGPLLFLLCLDLGRLIFQTHPHCPCPARACERTSLQRDRAGVGVGRGQDGGQGQQQGLCPPRSFLPLLEVGDQRTRKSLLRCPAAIGLL